MLAAAGCGIVETIAFSDHQPLSPANIIEIKAHARKLNATGLITTEKDAVKLSANDRARLETIGPLTVVPLHVEFNDPAALLTLIESRLERMGTE